MNHYRPKQIDYELVEPVKREPLIRNKKDIAIAILCITLSSIAGLSFVGIMNGIETRIKLESVNNGN